MRSYVTKQGDTWDLIAKSQLGSEYLMHNLIALNFKYRDILIFSSGTVLNIPDVKYTPSINSEQLPPWKRAKS